MNSIYAPYLLILNLRRGIIKKILLIIFDGLADQPIPALGNKTPLEVANIPNMNKLAERGLCGIQNALPKGVYPTSEEAHLAIFGYDYIKDLPGRGIFEAMGIGIKVEKKQLVFRVDFGSVDEGLKVIDPRSGVIKSVKSFCEHIGTQKIGPFTFKLYPGTAYRGILVIEGAPITEGISHHSTVVTDTDPHKSKEHRHGNKVLKPEPLDDSPEAKMTAEALWEYQMRTHKILNDYVENKVRKRSGLLPANFLLTRGAGFLKPVESFHDKYGLNAACVASPSLYRGIGKYLGMDSVELKRATGNIDTDIKEKLTASLERLKSGYDFVFMHLKGTDIVAEEFGDYEKKIKFLEKADTAFKPLLDFEGTLCITGDHATPCILKDHSLDAVPIIIVGKDNDDVCRFNEKDCARGSLSHLNGLEIMPKLIKEAKNV